nr:hypothetical protein [uncultured Brevundimonas sp.]
MSVRTKTRILRLGGARLLTRAVDEGDFAELNSHVCWDMPPE